MDNPIRRELERRRQQSAEPDKGKEKAPAKPAAVKTIRSVRKGGGIHPAVWVVGIIILAGVIALLTAHFTGLYKLW